MNEPLKSAVVSWLAKPGVRLAIFLAVSVASAVLAFHPDFHSIGKSWISRYGAHTITAELGILLFLVFKLLWGGGDAIRTKPPVWVYGFLVGLFLFSITREPMEFKIVNDEILLSAVAMNIHYNREVQVPGSGYEIQGRYELVGGYLDKRPAFYPVLLSIVHDITGYRISNAFYLNLVVTALLLWLLYWICREISDDSGALIGVSVFMLTPLAVQNATGGGFELLNVLMLLLSIWAGIRYLCVPTGATILAFCLSVLLLAQTRYESIIFLVSAIPVILYGWSRSRKIILPWGVMLIPVLFIPLVIQLQIPFYDSEWWQLEGSHESSFSFGYLVANLGGAVAYLFSMKGEDSSNILFSLAGTIALCVMALNFTKERKCLPRQKAIDVIGLFVIGILVHFCVILLYHAGDISKAYANRFALPMILAFSLALAFVLKNRVASRQTRFGIIVSLLSAVYLFSFPAFAKQSPNNVTLAKKKADWILERYASLPKGDYLLLIYHPWLYMLHKIPVTHLEGAVNQIESINFHLQKGSFDKIFVVQTFGIDPKTGTKVYKETDYLGDQFRLKELGWVRLLPYEYASLSLLYGVDVTKSSVNDAGSTYGGSYHFPVDPEVNAEWYRNLF